MLEMEDQMNPEPDDIRVVNPDFRHYAEPNPAVLEILRMDEEDWQGLRFYARVHANEFHVLMQQIAGKPKSILEWGTGLSTYLLCHFGHSWGTEYLLTIDDKKEYQEEVLTRLQPRPAFLETLHASRMGAIWPWEGPDHNYATWPLTRNRHFDLIFVDGRRRNECLLVASHILAPGGVVILHDSWRERYKAGTDLFKIAHTFDEYTVLKAR